jgi:hypothetical protein
MFKLLITRFVLNPFEQGQQKMPWCMAVADFETLESAEAAYTVLMRGNEGKGLGLDALRIYEDPNAPEFVKRAFGIDR